MTTQSTQARYEHLIRTVWPLVGRSDDLLALLPNLRAQNRLRTALNGLAPSELVSLQKSMWRHSLRVAARETRLRSALDQLTAERLAMLAVRETAETMHSWQLHSAARRRAVALGKANDLRLDRVLLSGRPSMLGTVPLSRLRVRRGVATYRFGEIFVVGLPYSPATDLSQRPLSSLARAYSQGNRLVVELVNGKRSLRMNMDAALTEGHPFQQLTIVHAPRR